MMESTLIVYPDGTDKPGVQFKCKSLLVSRIVSAVAHENIPDARVVCEILNRHHDEALQILGY